MINDAPESTEFVTDGVPESVKDFLESHGGVKRAHFLARLVGRNPVPRSLRGQFFAASASVAVMDVLSQLGPDWLVRTSAPCGEEGNEYVVIGPAGIFSLIVRHHNAAAVWIDGGVLLADGERLTDLRDAEFGAVRLAQLMSDAVESRVEVTPCLVLAGQRSLTVAKPPRRVAVMTLRDIRTWLRGMPKVLSLEEVEALHTAADAQASWHRVGVIQAESRDVLGLFRKVQAEVSQARHLRLTWVTGLLVLAWLIAVVGIGGVTTSFLAH